MKVKRLSARTLILAALVASCSNNNLLDTAIPISSTDNNATKTEVRLLTHDSFAVSEETFQIFENETGIEVVVQTAGDTGQLISTAVLTNKNPIADVIFGIDNTFMQRALDEDLFQEYNSPALSKVSNSLILDPTFRLLPVDYGDICVNYWIDYFSQELPPPKSLDDLIDPAYKDLFVVQNPETSSPGLGFLLATIAEYQSNWENYWESLKENNVTVTSSWESAYYGDFIAGGGKRPIVVSYASSPPAEVIYANPAVDKAPTAVITDTCFRQVEFVGILKKSRNLTESQALVDFMLSKTFQEDIPLNMFVFPAISDASIPDVFLEHTELPENPHRLDPKTIGLNRNSWTRQWTEVVLR
tara:strand:+ start:439 stop:1512 length:1074 start_codon:yes stop_codon:yes gene_type:complete